MGKVFIVKKTQQGVKILAYYFELLFIATVSETIKKYRLIFIDMQKKVWKSVEEMVSQ